MADNATKARLLRQSLTDELLQIVVDKVYKDWKLCSCDVKPAAAGLTGYLGDHFRVILKVKRGDEVEVMRLFVKSMPVANGMKERFITEGNFAKRELFMFQLFEEIGGSDGPHAWHPPAYIYTTRLLVMPDLTALGYRCLPSAATFPLLPARLVAAAIARFHAATTNYITTKLTQDRTFDFMKQNADTFEDPVFKDSPWIRAGAKLTANVIKRYSKYGLVPELEEKIAAQYIEACDDFVTPQDTLNVLVHRDLWTNNIMFRFENNRPVHAVILDFQCVRFGPPAFDVMIFLYLNTSRTFREKHERAIIEYYYTVFEQSLDSATKRRLKCIGYDLGSLLKWTECARRFSMLIAVSIMPYTTMSPDEAQKHFDGSENYDKYNYEDRSGPMLGFADKDSQYKERLVNISEEFVQMYVLGEK